MRRAVAPAADDPLEAKWMGAFRAWINGQASRHDKALPDLMAELVLRAHEPNLAAVQPELCRLVAALVRLRGHPKARPWIAREVWAYARRRAEAH